MQYFLKQNPFKIIKMLRHFLSATERKKKIPGERGIHLTSKCQNQKLHKYYS